MKIAALALCAATLSTLSISVHAQGDMSSLAKAKDSEIVAAARADANAYYAARKKAGKEIDYASAYMYASGRAIQRDLTDSLKELTYTNAFDSVIQFLMQENGEE
jgi:uncharacterized protein YbjT (DUF2867 family)